MNQFNDFFQKYFYILVPALLVIFYFYVTDGLLKENSKLKQNRTANTALLKMMQDNADSITSTQKTPNNQKTISPVEALSILEQSIKKHKLHDNLDNLRPMDSNHIRLWMKSAIFNDFINMLADLTTIQSLTPSDYHFRTAAEPGKVDIDITFSINQ